jgi:radical SAM superfamily enzyme YgiQ (UPF0313 family)
MAEIRQDILTAAAYRPDCARVFLMDGDALVMKTPALLEVLKELRNAFPNLKRVSTYANDFNINLKSDEELLRLADNRLKLMYMGLESGCQEILARAGKKSTAEGMIEAVHRAKEAGIKSSVIALLGLGGQEMSAEHAERTAAALNRMQPDRLSLLSLMLVPGTRLHREAEEGNFRPLEGREFLSEMYDIISRLELKRTIFHSNHASNYLALSGRLPQDRERFLEIIRQALNGAGNLRPEWLRGL